MAAIEGRDTQKYIETEVEVAAERAEYPHEALDHAIDRFEGVIQSADRLINRITESEKTGFADEPPSSTPSLHVVLGNSAGRLNKVQETLYQKLDEIEKLLF